MTSRPKGGGGKLFRDNSTKSNKTRDDGGGGSKIVQQCVNSLMGNPLAGMIPETIF